MTSEAPGGGLPSRDFANFPKYEEDLEELAVFLNTYQDRYSLSKEQEPKYLAKLQEIANREEKLLRIDLDDLYDGNPDLVERICRNAQRYIRLIESAADALLAAMEPTVDLAGTEDVRDVLQRQRTAQLQAARAADMDEDEEAESSPTNAFPAALVRRYEVRLLPPSASSANGGWKPLPLRQVKAEQIGALVRVAGIVTRCSDVKPLVEVATYTCDQCGFEIYQEVGLKTSFTPISTCPSNYCRENSLTGKLFMQTRGSKFIKYQELKLQELPDQVPVGNIPRSLTVTCRGELTRQCGPGEMVTVCGVFLPKRYTGFKGMKAGLISDTYLEASDVVRQKENYANIVSDNAMEARIDEAAEQPDVFSKLARSIAPEIYGHEDVKKALLLMLVGGAVRQLPDGMRIRGDMNVCLMGDPGVAKSQLLKYVTKISPRGVYTTGKGSSGVGLTAAVVKDPTTGDLSLEGGALVLADMGVCCIDEFDKMDEYDRTAIHEVMEQQTVSIAKAGITTTLNARCAVLAAANPLYGRYNRRKSMTKNINLPNSLLSRFDLLFLILDLQDSDQDTALARHITFVHKHNRNPELDFEPYEPNFIKHYIAAARGTDPFVPEELTSYIVEAYVELRQKDSGVLSRVDEDGDAEDNQAAMTARALLSILRLSQALARLRFAESVDAADVDEAIRLTYMSKASLQDVTTNGNQAGGGGSGDQNSRIFGVLRDSALAAGDTTLDFRTVEAQVLKRGFTAEAFFQCLEEYTELGVLQVDQARTRIMFVG